MPYATCHSVTCHPAVVTLPPLPQLKLVLDLATLEECKAELPWVVVTSQDSLLTKDGHLSQKSNQAASRPGTEPTTKSCEADLLTIRALRYVEKWSSIGRQMTTRHLMTTVKFYDEIAILG